MAALLTACFVSTAMWHLWCGVRHNERRHRTWRPAIDATCHVAMSLAMVHMLWLGHEVGAGIRIAQVVLFGLAAAWFLAAPRATPGRGHDVVVMVAMVWMVIAIDSGEHVHHGGVFAGSVAGQVTFVLVGMLGFGAMRNLIDGMDGVLREGKHAVPGRRTQDRWVAATMDGGMAVALALMVAAA